MTKTPRAKSAATRTAPAASKRSRAKTPSWARKITKVAELVVEVFSSDLPKGATLDFSPRSIATIDKVIKRIWGESGPSEENRSEMVWTVGAYIAEVLQRNYDGKWKNTSDGYSFECKNSGIGVSPWNWTAKRFEFGMSESLASKYKFAESVLKEDRKAVSPNSLMPLGSGRSTRRGALTGYNPLPRKKVAKH